MADDDVTDDEPMVEASENVDAFGANLDDLDGEEDELDDEGGGGMSGDAHGAGFSTHGHVPTSTEAVGAAPMTGSAGGAPFTAQGTGALDHSSAPAPQPTAIDVSTGLPIPDTTGPLVSPEAISHAVSEGAAHVLGEAGAHVVHLGGPMGAILGAVVGMEGDTPHPPETTSTESGDPHP